MNETDIAVKLENHDQQIKSLKHRMEEQEEQSKTIQELVLSVKELALNMQTMIEVQESKGTGWQNWRRHRQNSGAV